MLVKILHREIFVNNKMLTLNSSFWAHGNLREKESWTANFRHCGMFNDDDIDGDFSNVMG
jgi:hypothetical protein